MATTKTKRKIRKKRVAVAKQVEEPQKEVAQVGQFDPTADYALSEIERLQLEDKVEPKRESETQIAIDTVYIATRGRLDGYFKEDAEEWIKKIQRSGNDTEYKFYPTVGKPFYMAIQNETLKPFTFPEPDKYGTTSADLFAQAITCADAIAEFIRLKIRGKQGLAAQLMKPGVLGMALIVAIFLIFILSVYIGGGG